MPNPGPVSRLLHRLDLERDTTSSHDSAVSWIGQAGPNAMNMAGRLFGGFVTAQMIVAAGRTLPDRRIHAVQQVFLRGGQPDGPIRYLVTPTFEGRTYSSVTVAAIQHDAVISHAQVGLSAGFEGPDRSEPASHAAPPLENTVNRGEHRGRPNWQNQPIEFRLDPDQPTSGPHLDLWFRAAGDVPDDPLMHQALIGFASDRALMSVAAQPHVTEGQRMRGATLNHSLWFHREINLSDAAWHLYSMTSPSLAQGRGMCHGQIRDRDGVLRVTAAQEGTLRINDV